MSIDSAFTLALLRLRCHQTFREARMQNKEVQALSTPLQAGFAAFDSRMVVPRWPRKMYTMVGLSLLQCQAAYSGIVCFTAQHFLSMLQANRPCGILIWAAVVLNYWQSSSHAWSLYCACKADAQASAPAARNDGAQYPGLI